MYVTTRCEKSNFSARIWVKTQRAKLRTMAILEDLSRDSAMVLLNATHSHANPHCRTSKRVMHNGALTLYLRRCWGRLGNQHFFLKLISLLVSPVQIVAL